MKKLVTLLLLCTMAAALCGCSGGMVYSDAEKYTAGGAELSGAVERLEIDWVSGSVVIRYHDEDTVLIEESTMAAQSAESLVHWWLDGTTLRVKRMGGHNHADLEPATASDTAKLKKIAGGSFSWDCIPVILRADGKYVACSINTMPHGDQTITSNKYNGQFCLHMSGSTTHENDAVNANHQEAIEKAYNWAH